MAELKWLRHNQAALDARLQRVEDSLIFRTLRAIGTFYQANFAGEGVSAAGAYRDWSARQMGETIIPDPAWTYHPRISVIPKGGDLKLLETQTYRNWEIDSGNGDYVAELPEGVRLRPDALARAVAALQTGRPDCIYFDHEIVDASGAVVRPVFKPDWSPVLMESCDYRGEFVLRSAAPAEGAIHIPHIAYSTRNPPRIQPSAPALDSTPLVSIVICTRNWKLLKHTINGLRDNTSYRAIELVVVHHLGSDDDEGIIRVAHEAGAVRVSFAGTFNFSVMNNLGVKSANGDIILFLNDDVEPSDSKWLDRMVARLQRPETGIVGAKLLYPSGTIQHAGIVIWEMDGSGHAGRNLTRSDYWPWLNTTREVSAVTGACLAVRRKEFEALGGFDPEFPVNFNDVDLCMRYRRHDQSVVLEAGAVLVHDEGQTRPRGVSFEERRRFYLRWHEQLDRTDPFYNPNLVQGIETLGLRS